MLIHSMFLVLYMQFVSTNVQTVTGGSYVLYGGGANICQRFCGLKLWLLERLNLKHGYRKRRRADEFKIIKNQDKGQLDSHFEPSLSSAGQDSDGVSTISMPNGL